VKKIVNRKDTRERIEHVHKKQKKNKDNVHTPLYTTVSKTHCKNTRAKKSVQFYFIYQTNYN
jgi:hypothetical protein